MTPRGGSELLKTNLNKYLGSDWERRINLISSFTDYNIIDYNRLNVIWQHLHIDQGAVQGMRDPGFTELVDQYVYVSNWQLDQFNREFAVDRFSNTVIKNAIEPIEFIEKPQDRIRLIYTSMPDRGLEVLLKAWKILNLKDAELVVYSSNIIYGKLYSDSRAGIYDRLFQECKNTKGVIYKGFALNRAVRKALQTAHILAYPSIYPETSCLAAIEAGAAGCKILTTDFGAIPETCEMWAEYVPYDENIDILAESYALKLKNLIDSYSSLSYNIKEQSDWFNTVYSWETRAKEWQLFFGKL